MIHSNKILRHQMIWTQTGSYERYISFVNNVTITLSDEEMIKIKIVGLDEFYNFSVHNFLSSNLVSQNFVWMYHLLKFKI